MYTALADGVVEVGLTDGKVTVYINVTQRKNTRIDISSGEAWLKFKSYPLRIYFVYYVFNIDVLRNPYIGTLKVEF